MPNEPISIAPPPSKSPGRVSDLALQISNLERTTEEALQSKVRLEALLVSKEQELEQVKQEALEAIEEGELEIAGFKKQLASALTLQQAEDLRRELARTKQRAEQEEGRGLALLEEKRLLEREVGELRGQARGLEEARQRAQAAEAKASGLQVQLEEVKREGLEAVEEGEAENRKLKDGLAQAEKSLEINRVDRARLEKQNRELQEELDRRKAFQAERERLKQDLDALVARAGDLERKGTEAGERCRLLESEMERKARDAEEKIRQWESEAAGLRRDLGAAAAGREAAERKVREAEERCRALESEMERKIREAEERIRQREAEAEQLRGDLGGTAAGKETAEQKVREAEERCRVLESEMERKIREAEERIRQRETEAEQLRGDLGGAAAGKETAEQKVREAEERARRLESEGAVLRRDLERLRTEGTGDDALRQRLRIMEEELLTLRARVEREEEDWQNALETVDRYKADFERSDRRVHELEVDGTAHRRELEAREREIQVFKEQISTLQGTLSMLRSELTRVRAEPQPRGGGGDAEWLLTALATLAQVRTGRAEGGEVLRNLLQPAAARAPSAEPPSASFAVVPAAAGRAAAPVDPEQAGELFVPTGHHLRQLEQVDLEGDVHISLDQLRCAVLDSQWRDKWIAGENPPVFNGPSARFRGKPEEFFYDIVRRFLEWLVDPVGAANAAGFGEKELWQCMYDLHAAEVLNRMVARNDFAGTNHVSRRLRAFCRRLSHLKDRAPAFGAWTDVVASADWNVARSVFPLREKRLVIGGRCHGLRRHPAGGLEMAAWKVEPEASEGEDHRELALLALVFAKAHPQRPLHYVSEVYTQDVEAREVVRAVLNRELRERVVPVFYDLAGMARPEVLQDPGLEFFVDPHTAEIVD